MYEISKRWSSPTVYRIVLDEQLRERFCERLKQQLMILSNHITVSNIHHRSLLLAGHRGEVSFPGGRLEQGETHEEAALRETAEEIGLYSCQIEVWGRLKHVTTRFMSTVTPVVGLVQETTDFSTIRAKRDEVQTVFAAPIEELCTSHRYTHFRRVD
uniref:Nudix hydrolase domain-containing protein n=1 Tax=Loa loa TaxID=7209 RepID=A0A1I7VGV5_LOALO